MWPCSRALQPPLLRRLTAVWCAGLLLLVAQFTVAASGVQEGRYDDALRQFFPSATRFAAEAEGRPIRVAYQLNEVIGYALVSNDHVDLKGFSGERINLLIGMDTKGSLQGLQILHHHEPIFLHGLGPEPLLQFVDQYRGHRLSERIIIDGKADSSASDSNVYFDGITKATVSVMVINDTIISAAREVARQVIADFAQVAAVRIRQDNFTPMGWPQLLEQGLVQRLIISPRQLQQALPGTDLASESSTAGSDEAVLTLYLLYLNPPLVGRNFLGDSDYQRLLQKLEPGEHAIALFSTGLYDYLGEEFRPGTAPARVSLSQQSLPIGIRDLNFFHITEPRLSSDVPFSDNLRLFRIRPQAGFNPSAPTQLTLTINVRKNHLSSVSATFSDTHSLPATLFEVVEQARSSWRDKPWIKLWMGRLPEIAILLAGLALLTLLFIRQQALITPAPRFFRIRHGFLAFTLLFIGFHAQGQLSVVNIYPLLLALQKDFDLSVYLLDPVILILWLYVLVTLLLWGRGLFCGWLCPFGVMQEWTALLAQRLRIRQWRIPERLHQRLLWVKYLLLAGLLGTALVSITAAEKAAEVEPFKTAVTLGFVREWPFVVYALLLLGAGLFVHKFYCRYLCPLGAFLALAGKLHRFEWLQRRSECGSPCQLCRRRCGIQAIAPGGDIDYNECIQCLECVVILEDANQCAPQRSATKRAQSANQVKTAEYVQP
ncbi:4Fe-4S binding protein [Pseudomaricurvus sp. HS19]|uniref:4Fe-4S binding protein n=1 Tax=Pseudomaricurvus sp. HS19 TaxID=2692626 RepID=UPI001368426D|nr:4Fe-4S binding protein [Pseudomaricurvus sp. HS19]MYM64855.1 4Fe-4S binding protein [Pseudomaricurvus sp. HS19]